MSKALEEDIGSDLSRFSNKELEKEVDTAGPVMYDGRLGAGGELVEISLSSRRKFSYGLH